METYMGVILPIAFLYAPEYCIDCHGQMLPTSQYQALYALLGTTYGGNNTNFGVPNLQNRFMVGGGMASSNLPPSWPTPLTQGATGGVASAVLAVNQLPAHTHPATATAGSQSGMTVTLPPFTASATTNTQVQAVQNSGSQANASAGSYLSGVSGSLGRDAVDMSLYAASTSAGTVTLGGVSSSTSVSVGPNGTATVSGAPSVNVLVGPNATASTPLATLPPYLAVRFCMVVQGLWPTRAEG